MKKEKYIELREKVITEVTNLTVTHYRDDKEIQSGVIGLTVDLQKASPDRTAKEFIEGMHGFMMWAQMTSQEPRKVLTTLIHDLGEFSRNRTQNWFCPRTAGYQKYLSGASNQQP